MKVTSKVFYKELNSILNPGLKQAGFRTAAGGRLGWVRPSGDAYLAFWFQTDKWGGDACWGSKFTLEFTLGSDPTGAQGVTADRFERIGHLLAGFQDLDDLRVRNNQVIERLPGTLEGRLAVVQLDDGSDYVAEGERVDLERAVTGRDIWLNYYSLSDVRLWGAYFEVNLPRFISIFESCTKSDERLAADRFNDLVAHVQSANDVEGKERAIRSYIDNESHEGCRDRATNLLEDLAELKSQLES